MVSIRSSLSAGIAAGLVLSATGAAAVSAPAAVPELRSVASPAVELSAVMAALPQPAAALPTPPDPFVIPTGISAGDWIINGYNAIQPWVQYGVELAAWAVSWLPWPIGLIGPQANILYSGWQPIGQALVYDVAYLLDRQFELIVPTLVNGLKTGLGNLVQGEIQWVLSFFPPLPPIQFPTFPGAATPARSAATLPRGAATVATSAAVDAGSEQALLADPAPAADQSALADSAPAAESAPTPRAPRAAVRGAKRAQRVAPAASAAPTGQAPAPTVTKTRAGKAKAGAASSTRTGRAGR